MESTTLYSPSKVYKSPYYDDIQFPIQDLIKKDNDSPPKDIKNIKNIENARAHENINQPKISNSFASSNTVHNLNSYDNHFIQPQSSIPSVSINIFPKKIVSNHSTQSSLNPQSFSLQNDKKSKYMNYPSCIKPNIKLDSHYFGNSKRANNQSQKRIPNVHFLMNDNSFKGHQQNHTSFYSSKFANI